MKQWAGMGNLCKRPLPSFPRWNGRLPAASLRVSMLDAEGMNKTSASTPYIV